MNLPSRLMFEVRTDADGQTLVAVKSTEPVDLVVKLRSRCMPVGNSDEEGRAPPVVKGAREGRPGRAYSRDFWPGWLSGEASPVHGRWERFEGGD